MEASGKTKNQKINMVIVVAKLHIVNEKNWKKCQ